MWTSSWTKLNICTGFFSVVYYLSLQCDSTIFTYYSSQIRPQYGSSDLLANWIPEVDDKEDAKTRYGYFHGYDDHV